ncbi:MAG: hypothetical protein H8E37_10075 [Planctomycetes bacterium]|nr:hypothetical protein [Planctomycetota bacterium]
MDILLVEDDAEVRGGLSAFLRSCGFQVEAATSETSAKSITGSLDAVISGYRMNSLQVEQLVASRNERAPAVPVIVTVTTASPGSVSGNGVELIDARDGVGSLLHRLQELEKDLAALEKAD